MGSGDAGAQFMLGTIYENRKGVPKDFIEAYAWYNIAKVHDDSELIAKGFNRLENKMTPAQIAEAQKLSKAFWDRIFAKTKIIILIIKGSV